ncbi:GMC oxidoreductase [Atractiella rhizophila]|nr:GMC oxidoreductase [Atractiella rhizophila]
MMSAKDILPEVDIIVVGGGASATVLTATIAQNRPDLQILLIEHGRYVSDDLSAKQPGRYRDNISSNVRWLEAGKSKVAIPSVLGGGGTVGAMEYWRPCKEDFSSWGPEWDWNELLQCAQKVEKTILDSFGSDTHGKVGPLEVSYGGHEPELAQEFLLQAIEHDVPHVPDLNDFTTDNGCAYLPKWITNRTALRSDPVTSFLLPLKPRLYSSSGILLENPSNLHIVTEAEVSRIILQDRKAEGVEYQFSGTTRKATARRMVILCAGAVGTPRILLNSGIGTQEELGIDSKVKLAGVGKGLMMEQYLPTSYHTSSVDTMDAFFRGDPYLLQTVQEQFNLNQTGWLTTNGVDAACRFKPPNAVAPFSLTFTSSHPGPHTLSSPPMSPGKLPGNFFTLSLLHSYSSSRGSVSRSRLSIPEPTKNDIKAFGWGYKFSRSLARGMPSSLGEHEPSHPSFPPSSPVRTEGRQRPSLSVVSSLPPPGESKRSRFAEWNVLDDSMEEEPEELKYGPDDDVILKNWIKDNLQFRDPSGTCAMKPEQEGGVVDSRLNVYNVEGLRIADLSILPSPVSGPLYTTALIIGLRASSFILADLDT